MHRRFHRKISVAASIIAVFCCVTTTVFAAASAASLETFTCDLTINNIKYSGSYTGETVKGQPSGTGVFETDENSPAAFTYSGEFQYGLFDGKGSYTLPDGSCLTCTSSGGVPSGIATLSYSDGSYAKFMFNSYGVPYGRMTTYSQDKTVTGCDFFNNGELVSDLVRHASEVPYHKLYRNADGYYGAILKVKGTVISVCEDEELCTFRLQDADGNVYWASYSNTSYLRFDQAIMPTLREGDSLTLYAFSKGLSSYAEDSSENGYLLPELSPITAQLDGETLVYADLSMDYEDILRYPYYYYNILETLEGTVLNIIQKSKTYYVKIRDADGNIYYVIPNDKTSFENVVPGDRIKVTGKFRGLYKKYSKSSKGNASLRLLLKATKKFSIL